MYEKKTFNTIGFIENTNFLIKLDQQNEKTILNNFDQKQDIKFIYYNSKNKKYFASNEMSEIKNSLNVYDLHKENTNRFDCVKSANMNITTTLCLHDLKRDVFISQNIKSYGSWETQILKNFMKILNSNRNIHVFDIGAHIGQFTLYSAKFGRKVIAVEPFYDNFIRIHKAAQLENLTQNIILVINGISDKRGKLEMLKKNEKNIGGQGIDEKFNSSFIETSKLLKNKYILRTIELDDLILILPENVQEAIIKIDIEGNEIKAFKKAKKLFDRVKFHAVFIEWMGKNRPSLFKENEINNFLDFMYKRNFICINPLNFLVLDRKFWKFWPGDILFIQKKIKLDVFKTEKTIFQNQRTLKYDK